MHHLRSLFVCLLVFVTLPLGANAQLRRDIRRWKPLAQTPFSLWNSEIELKIKEGYAISVRGEAILDARGKVILSLKNELKGLPFIASRQAFGLDLQAVRALVKRARSRCRCNVADLSLYVTFKTSATEAQRYALLERLNDHPAVEIAYPKSRPVRPPVDIPPTTPDYSGNQDYFGAAPSGIAVDAVRSMPGGHGEGIHVVDVEFNFHADHEDLETCKNAVIPGATGLYSDPEYVYHGTSVLGILFGGDNGYGVTGSLTKGVCHFSPDYSDYWGYDVARGITSGALAVDAPAIFLLEAQEGGPNYDPNTGAGLIPSEWLPGVFDAISAVVAAGYVVVEAAGNGWEDLDDPVYADAFNREVNDSGAI
ncbi:hypothetical protein KJ865_08305, partial [Myxococcota bacterium]|nr:hypothetical protein [Myxococcota bacterium]